MFKNLCSFFWVVLCSSLLLADIKASSPETEQKIKVLDTKIEMLEDEKNRYKASRARHLDNANRWQFESQMFSETRREYELADQDMQKIESLDKQIQALKLQKKELLEKDDSIP